MYQNDSQSIELNIKDIVLFVLRKAHILALSGFFLGVVLGGYGYFKSSISAPDNSSIANVLDINTRIDGESDIEYENRVQLVNRAQTIMANIDTMNAQSERLSNYISNSIIMQIDPMNVSVSEAQLIIVLDKTESVGLDDALIDSYALTAQAGDYIGGIVDVAFKDQQGNVKVRKGQKIGKLIAKDTISTSKGNINALDLFSADPVRLSKNIKSAISSNDLWIVISNHAYDIAGMSTNRDWTSCMNIIGGECKEYVEKDIEYGTLVCYIIDKKDTNIEHPYGRILIKPYKLQRPNYHGFSPCPIVYSPEVTVYSPYIGLKPIREWLKDICEDIQEGEGILRSLKELYNDNFHDDVDTAFHGKRK